MSHKYTNTHRESDASKLSSNMLPSLMEEERAASLKLLDVVSSFSSCQLDKEYLLKS